MYKLYYQFPNTWFGDCMPFGKDGKFYLYHQRDTRKPGPIWRTFRMVVGNDDGFCTL